LGLPVMSQAQRAKAEAFRALHVRGDPLILFNAWDAGSARAVARAGARAIGTGSWSVAAAHGFPDGETMPLDLVLANAERIAAAVELPVSIDMVRGYGEQPAEIAKTVRRLWEAGAVGCNVEDSLPDGSGLSPVAEQAERLRAAKEAAPSMFVNARVDLFLRTPADRHDEALLDRALDRGAAYVEAGADGIFVPGLADEALIERFCKTCPRPVNILVGPDAPSAARLAGFGVARISHGPWPYREAMARLEEAARAALG
jgi:2-methylisocitrate lyase-like PEP mutase family enzyme